MHIPSKNLRYFFILFSAAIFMGTLVFIDNTTNNINAQESTPSNDTDLPQNTTIESMKQNFTEVIENINFKTLSNVSSPSVAVAPENDTIYLSYVETKNNQSNLYMTVSKDRGLTFSEPVRVNDKIGDVDQYPWTTAKIGLGPNNEVYVLWHVIDETNEDFAYGMSSLRFAKSIDGGSTFLPTSYPANDTVTEKAFFDLAVSDDNSVYITYLDSLSNVTDFTISYPSEVRVLHSEDGGESFGKPIVIDNTACDCCKTSAATAQDGELYVLWRHASHIDTKTYANGTNPYNYEEKLEQGVIYEVIRDVYVTHSNDSGKGNQFMAPIIVHKDNWFMNGCPGAGPDLGFDSNQVLHVSWFTGGGDQPGTYYANTSIPTMNFSKPLPLLTDEWIPTSETNLAVDGNDNVWITTTDDRSENGSKVFMAAKSDDGTLYKNQEFAPGEDPIISAGENIVAVAWTSNDDANLAILNVKSE